MPTPSAARPAVLPAREEKAAAVRRMFSSIAPRYDLLNHLLSANVDRVWRRRAVDRLGWERAPAGVYLDNCALTLPFGDAAFDGATVGFGVRNLADLDAGLAEMARVLKPGARLVILEFTTPSWQPFRALYLGYFLKVLPLVGRMVSRHSTAYTYLPESVRQFPEPPELAAKMERAGFGGVGWKTLSGGIAALHWGVRT